jgi:hypothetical protein
MHMRSTERLAEVICQKHQVLVRLREIAQRQANLVATGDITSLLTLLATKQQLISALQEIERELMGYYEDDPDQRVWKSPQDRAACAERVAVCNALLEEIVHLEKDGAEMMAARRNEVAQQLEQAHSASHVRSAYEAHRHNQAS